MTLDQIFAPVREELKIFKKKFKNQLIRSKIPLVDSVVRFIIQSRGKNLRPGLVLIGAKCCQENILEATYFSAMAVELIHTATLVHDDVVDGADMRRNRPSVNALWNNKVAVLMGDFLLANALICMVATQKMEAMTLVSDVARRTSEGELLQNDRSRRLDMNESTYYRMIADKTGALISCACELGAITTRNRENDRIALRQYGLYTGMAFQIRDDIFDYTGNESVIGKTKGRDLIERNLTLPLLYALRRAPKNESRRVLAKIKRHLSKEDVSYVHQFVDTYNGITYAESKIDEYSEKAIQSLDLLPETEAKSSLIRFVIFNKNRSK